MYILFYFIYLFFNFFHFPSFISHRVVAVTFVCWKIFVTKIIRHSDCGRFFYFKVYYLNFNWIEFFFSYKLIFEQIIHKQKILKRNILIDYGSFEIVFLKIFIFKDSTLQKTERPDHGIKTGTNTMKRGNRKKNTKTSSNCLVKFKKLNRSCGK